MPRPLVVGNGSLLVNFDNDLYIRDLYYPHVGMENHVEGHECRLGVWVDGRFSWIDGSWKKSLRYRDDAMVTDVTLRKEEMGLELRVNDAVHYSENIFVRRVTIKNTADRDREVRLFLSHDFHLYGISIGDTAHYDPALKAVIHYKNERYFLIRGISGDEGLYQFSIGIKEFAGAEGTWRDAEDGVLSNNPIAQGSVDSTVSLRATVPKDGRATVYYWIAAGRNFREVERLNKYILEHGPGKLIDETEIYHRSWVEKQELNFDKLPEKVVNLFKRSLLIIRTQIDNSGGVVAANDSDILRFNRDTYSYVWPRDGAFVTYGLVKAGYIEVANRFFEFCARGQTKRGFLLHKYNPNGTFASSWLPWLGSDGKSQLPIQEDETALVVYALWHHYDLFRNIEFAKAHYEGLVKRAADFMVEYRHPRLRLPLPSYDLWEERRGILTFTSAAVYAGLLAAARFAELFGDPDDASRYREAAEEVRKGIMEHLYDEKEKRFLRMVNIGEDGALVKDYTVDSSLYALFEFGVLPPHDPRVVSTMEAVKARLWCRTGVGGLARYEGDQYHRVAGNPVVPGNPWFICTLWLAQWYIAKARTD
ncbi:MAG: glycoside hydrolase family 15 protein, partial [Candidatus Hydrothermarchaeota archaeon]